MAVPSAAKGTWRPLLNALLLHLTMKMVVGGVNGPAHEVIAKFSRGNRKYRHESRDLKERGLGHQKRNITAVPMLDQLMDPPLEPMARQAIIISDACNWATVDELFSTTQAGLLDVVRVSGCICGDDDHFDGVIASVEYALMQEGPPPLLMVLGHTQNKVIEDAVRLALSPNAEGVLKQSPVVQAVLPAAIDAVSQDPYAAFDDLCQVTAKLNVWNTVEKLLTTSQVVHDLVKAGELEVHGSFCDDIGKVHFMGEHPANDIFLATRPGYTVRTAKDPPVPPEEAMAMLYAGNQRYINGKSINSEYLSLDRNEALTKSGQLPFAVVIGCADSRAPPEVLFDARPGNLFILRIAGNTFGNMTGGALLGSAEYAVGHLKSKLVVVMAHTKCGAATAAVEAVKAKTDLKDVPGSIGRVLFNLQDDAIQAISMLPDASTAEQVALTSRLGVFTTMKKIIKQSAMIADGVQNMEVQVQGAIYDIESGKVEWLGQHPDLPEILGLPMPIHRWKELPYVRAAGDLDKSLAAHEIELLREGNVRFMNRQSSRKEHGTDAIALILAPAELKIPVEDVFDTSVGSILVQRSMGSIIGHSKNSLFSSLEYQVQRFHPRLLLVLGARESRVIVSAMEHLAGEDASFGPTHIVHEAVGASALKALMQSQSKTTGGLGMKQARVTAELNAFYTVEQLLRHSDIIRAAVKGHKLDIQVGILRQDTGRVDFVGPHPMQHEFLKDVEDDEENVRPHSLLQVAQEVKPTEEVKPTRHADRKKNQPPSLDRLRALLFFLLFHTS